tara:strand:- start:32 stop:448 length:417 start_codon:yes stop_codon:yes gene_type:complete
LIEIIANEIFVWFARVSDEVEVICDVAVDIINDAHEPSDAKDHDDQLYDLDHETDDDDFINFVLVDFDVVSQFFYFDDSGEPSVVVRFDVRHQHFLLDQSENADDSVTFEQEEQSAVSEGENGVAWYQKEEVDPEITF